MLHQWNRMYLLLTSYMYHLISTISGTKNKVSKDEIKTIVDEINLKIDDFLENKAESIYIAELLTRIWKKHPEFNIEVEKMEDIKLDPLFLCYLKELNLKSA